MTNLESVKKILKILNQNNISYFISGGYAVEVLREIITRKHKDLDIYVFEENIPKLLDLFKKEDYNCFKKLNKYEIRKERLIVDILPLKKIYDKRVIIGNSGDTYYPAIIFNKIEQYYLENTLFRLVPNEILVFEGKYSKYEKDREITQNLDYNKDLISQIKHIPKEKPSKIYLEKI